MTVSDNILKLLGAYEGISLSAYQINGDWTIGIGHAGKYAFKGARISLAQAFAIKRQDIARFASAVQSLVSVPLLQHEFDALVSLAFNMGENAFKKTQVLALVNQGKKQEAAQVWRKTRLMRGYSGITRRREAEAYYFLSGLFTADATERIASFEAKVRASGGGNMLASAGDELPPALKATSFARHAIIVKRKIQEWVS
jgi:lysozyme